MTKRHFDKLADDHRLIIPVDRFRIRIFNCVLDVVNAQLQTRIKGMHAIFSRRSIIFPGNLINKEENIITQLSRRHITRISNSAFNFSHKQWKVKLKKSHNSSVRQVADLLNASVCCYIIVIAECLYCFY